MELRAKCLPGVKVNHELLFQKVRASDRKLYSILQFVQDFACDDNYESDEKIFCFDEEKLTLRN